ncbi:MULTISPECIES: alpha/beta hydrolase [Pseudonocardia]|uniref:Alpha/beta hydrolase fold n=1 Tax=Pseudonocardia oroxyli TaxID=366584 RepID=A0A1G8A1J9_PSEOR|nr:MULTISPECIES: alpha/beta hydrolase [Pseudonocardia]MCF7548102.1 alpha/beta hydrolase [Pseudonocardia sp. WMMC193]SDH14707.1 alpha/beta hydrolase fold [Pseudonocardia oroxyli]
MLPRRRSPFTATLRTLTALAAVVAVAAGCSATPATPDPPSPAPDPLQRFTSQQLSWGSCDGFAASPDVANAYRDPSLECAKLTVPLDYANPDGRTAELAVLRAKATGQRIGSMLVNPGGPGVSGTSLVPSLVQSAPDLLQRFDFVGFDPRGVGVSSPAIDCLTDAEQDEYRAQVFADPSPAGVAALEAHNKEYADRCTARVGADVLANLGTRDVVRDLDILRAALGDEKLTYYGYSYGTSIGTQYAEAFPDRVRAMVLDGAVDPTQDTVESNIDQSAGFQQAFDAYATWCTTQPNCPLGTDPARTTETWLALARPLLDDPVKTGDPTRRLSFTDAVTGVQQAMYVRQLWTVLSLGISQLAAGDGSLLLTLADLYYKRSGGHYDNSLEAFQAISCMDNTRVTDPAALADGVEKAAPFTTTGRGPVAARDVCAFWPVPPTTEPGRPDVPGLPPVVVVSVTGDPATPYQAGVDLAADLGGRLLKVDGNQHTAGLQGNACVDSALTAYLVDGTLPGDGTECRL